MSSRVSRFIVNTLNTLRRYVDVTDGVIENAQPNAWRSSASFLPHGVTTKEMHFHGVEVHQLLPKNARTGGLILYLHGGGYALSTSAMHHPFIARIAKSARCEALSVEYRLAPQCPYPCALYDVLKVYRMLLKQGQDPQQIVVLGDSAGGGLALASVLALRDAGDPLPAGIMTMSAWADLTLSGESMTKNAEYDPLLSHEALEKLAGWYVGEHDRQMPFISPVFGDYTGMPPMLMQVSDCEVLYDDSVRVAERARGAGVEDVTLDVWHAMPHVWQLFAPVIPESLQAIDRIGAWVQAHTGGDVVEPDQES